jgi:hypothetical protein
MIVAVGAAAGNPAVAPEYAKSPIRADVMNPVIWSKGLPYFSMLTQFYLTVNTFSLPNVIFIKANPIF